MATVRIHQEVLGYHAGVEVDEGKIPASVLRWLVGEGYASTSESRETDHANVQTAALLEDRPTEDGPERENAPAEPPSNEGLNPPEAFDPGQHTVGEVRQYLEQIPEGTGRDQETSRVKAVEADGRNRNGIAEL